MTQATLFDLLERNVDAKPREIPPHVAAPTSREAAESIAEHAPNLRARVIALIREAGGLTCDEVEERTGLRHQTAAARIREAVKAGDLADGGTTRPTRSGRKAIVWVAREGPE